MLLDVGSGPGFVTTELARRTRRATRGWTLLDPQRAMLANRRGTSRAALHAPGLSRVVGDAADLPIRSSSVDIVLSLGVLCCVAGAAVPAVVAETERVLKPGGWLLFAVPRWRGADDEARWARAGFRAVVTLRPGRGLFQKAL